MAVDAPIRSLFVLARMVQKASGWVTKWAGPSKPRESASEVVLDQYVHTMPSAQNAIDAVPGWTQAMPPHVGAVAGALPIYPDIRINWCLEQFGSIAGRKVLELGPLEGLQTYLLDQQQPDIIYAIEANRLSFLRCLVTKELLDLKRTKFLHGNFVPWLEQTDITYDLIVASGVLYHMSEPIRLLELIAKRTDALYIWTHYFSDEVMQVGDVRRAAFSGEVKTVDRAGARIALHCRSYHGAWKNETYCGGMHDRHYWMEREGILDVLRGLGFDDIRLAHEQLDHPAGPGLSIFARRTHS